MLMKSIMASWLLFISGKAMKTFIRKKMGPTT